MAEPQTNAAVVSFEDTTLGSASEELKRFDVEVGVACLEYLSEIAAGKIDHWNLAEFANYRAIPMY